MDATHDARWSPSSPAYSVKPASHITLSTVMMLVLLGLILAFVEVSVLARPSAGFPSVADPALATLFG